jgi:hypothetical protein
MSDVTVLMAKHVEPYFKGSILNVFFPIELVNL